MSHFEYLIFKGMVYGYYGLQLPAEVFPPSATASATAQKPEVFLPLARASATAQKFTYAQ